MTTTTDAMSQTVQTLIEKVQAKLKEVAELKRVTNALCREAGMDPAFDEDPQDDGVVGSAHVRVRPDEFYGKSVLTAARMYLERRKQAVTANEILTALQTGGFDFDDLGWREDNLLRALSMSMSKNTAMFHRLPNGTFGLSSWYDATILKKKQKKAKGEAADDESAEENDTADE